MQKSKNISLFVLVPCEKAVMFPVAILLVLQDFVSRQTEETIGQLFCFLLESKSKSIANLVRYMVETIESNKSLDKIKEDLKAGSSSTEAVVVGGCERNVLVKPSLLKKD